MVEFADSVRGCKYTEGVGSLLGAAWGLAGQVGHSAVRPGRVVCLCAVCSAPCGTSYDFARDNNEPRCPRFRCRPIV